MFYCGDITNYCGFVWCHCNDVTMGLQSPASRLFTQPFIQAQIKETTKLRVTGLYAENSPVTGEFPAHRASNAENVSIWWRHHVLSHFDTVAWPRPKQAYTWWRHQTETFFALPLWGGPTVPQRLYSDFCWEETNNSVLFIFSRLKKLDDCNVAGIFVHNVKYCCVVIYVLLRTTISCLDVIGLLWEMKQTCLRWMTFY